MVFSGPSSVNPGAGGLDHRREVAALNVAHAGPGDEVRGEDAVHVRLRRLLDAVRRHEDRAGEGGELAPLVLPRPAVVAHEVGERPQRGVAVGGEHLAVGVDVDPRALRLAEELVEVLEVVPGDDDRLALHRGHPGLGRRGVAERLGVPLVEQLHRPQVGLPAAQGEGEKSLAVEAAGEKCGQGLVEERVYLVVLST